MMMGLGGWGQGRGEENGEGIRLELGRSTQVEEDKNAIGKVKEVGPRCSRHVSTGDRGTRERPASVFIIWLIDLVSMLLKKLDFLLIIWTTYFKQVSYMVSSIQIVRRQIRRSTTTRNPATCGIRCDLFGTDL
jgi:hypothetical protein